MAYAGEKSREIRYPRDLAVNLKDSVEDDQFLAEDASHDRLLSEL